MGEYKDSAELAGSIYDEYKIEKIKESQVGDYIFFGAYEQDNDMTNGKEDIEWLVLEIRDGKALVISKYGLDCQPYNMTYTDVTWETCSLRSWLNNKFLSFGFSATEQARIPEVNVSAGANSAYNTYPGKATKDRVFLLSISDIYRYFNSDSARQCKPTEYAIANGAHVDSDNDNCWWWLRSPGSVQHAAVAVYGGGAVDEFGDDVDSDKCCVRPAIWIEVSN